jgi:predicted DCC family thiol-disulfide oxidoreductase YuxK
MLVFFMTASDEKIVLFDGVCNYCNSMINLAIRNDKKGVLKFAVLQSEAGKQLKSKYSIPSEIDSVIFIENGKVYTYSDAAIKISRYLRWPAKALYGLIIVPKFIRQPVYKWIARNRYKWFGKRKCMIPTPDIKSRFLD